MTTRFAELLAILISWAPWLGADAEAEPVPCLVRLTVTSELPWVNVPMDPSIDFGALVGRLGLEGVLDPNSIAVVDLATHQPVPRAITEDFAYADRGRVEWVIRDPAHKEYEIRFEVVRQRPPHEPADYTPLVGVGDLLRYNAGVPRPIALPYPSRLVDVNGDGKRDLVGCWNYAYRPGWPWDGIVYYPRVGSREGFEFGDLVRVRYVPDESSTDFRHFSKIYMHADLADLDRDGRIDLVYSPSGGDRIHLYLNTGRRDPAGTPVFSPGGSLSRHTDTWRPCRAADLSACWIICRTCSSRSASPGAERTVLSI